MASAIQASLTDSPAPYPHAESSKAALGRKWWYPPFLRVGKGKGKQREYEVKELERRALRRLVRVGKGVEGDDWVKKVEPGMSTLSWPAEHHGRRRWAEPFWVVTAMSSRFCQDLIDVGGSGGPCCFIATPSVRLPRLAPSEVMLNGRYQQTVTIVNPRIPRSPPLPRPAAYTSFAAISNADIFIRHCWHAPTSRGRSVCHPGRYMRYIAQRLSIPGRQTVRRGTMRRAHQSH